MVQGWWPLQASGLRLQEGLLPGPWSRLQEGVAGREVVLIALIPLVRTESRGRAWLQGRLGNVVLYNMQPCEQL